MNVGQLIWDSLFLIILLLNIIFVISVVFLERKNPSATLAWVMALVFLPVVGFILYLFLGQTYRKDKMFRMKKEEDQKLQDLIESEKKELMKESTRIQVDHTSSALRRMVLMLLDSNDAIITLKNQVRVYTDGKEKFADLIRDIKGTTDFIHLEYYIWKNDELGNDMRIALTERARAGVEVRLLCDGLGCAGLPRHFFDDFKEAGGKVAFFFPSFLRILNLRYNFRNHRKIAIVDGKTGYIGGFNIGDDYLGKDKKWGYWRDTAVRIQGEAVLTAQIRFFLDWNYAAPENQVGYSDRYFPDNRDASGKIPIQIVSGGPDTEFNPIKESYLKMITIATESVYLQTPYFIPDESVLDALRIAALSGIDVRIMMPDRPDHPFVYWAGISYIRQLLDSGVKAYTYDNGFLHAKTIVIDETAASVGSANWDVRSFRLNFETNAVMYDTVVARELKEKFIKDLDVCSPITYERLDALPWTKRVLQSIARLFSPML